MSKNPDNFLIVFTIDELTNKTPDILDSMMDWQLDHVSNPDVDVLPIVPGHQEKALDFVISALIEQFGWSK